MRNALAMLGILACAFAATPAWAGLIGTKVSMSANYPYPDEVQATLQAEGGNGTVSPTASFATAYTRLLVTDAALQITELIKQGITYGSFSDVPNSFNGFQMTDNDVDFTSVMVDESQTHLSAYRNVYPDLDAFLKVHPIIRSFDAHNIFIDLTNVSMLPADLLQLDIVSSPVTNIPEPVTLSLFAAGLGGTFAARRRKTRRNFPDGARHA